MKKTSILILALAIFASCHNSSSEKDKQSSRDLTLVSPQSSTSSGEDKLTETTDKSFNDSVANPSQIILQGSAPNSDWDKKIIKTAFLKLEVKDFKIYTEISHKAAKQYGGYIANEEQSQSEEKIESTISIKVPVEQFESIMNQLSSGAEKMVEKKITAEDVTGEVVDTKSRLLAKKQMRLKYLEFLKQSKNMEDVLRVQSEINNIQEEIESASGRINYLSHQSAYSTVNLTFYQPLTGYTPPNENPGFFTRTIAAFKSGFSFIGDFLIGVFTIWPLLLFVFIGWLIVKKYRLGIITAKQKL
jgi:hypothetical protein